MKNLLFIVALLIGFFSNSQAYSGKGDQKLSLGASFQELATGVFVVYDVGLGENISIGVNSTYALDIPDTINAEFIDRFDAKIRFNANLGNVINIDDNFDVYPGISLSLKNFGGHIGARYFFTDSFGVFSEFGGPFAKYSSKTLSVAELIHNKFVANFGMVFNLE